MSLSGLEVLVGTYEEFVIGIKIVKKESTSEEVSMTPSFTDHGHSASVRCIAAGDKFLLTGSSDEVVKVYNLRSRRSHGSLMHHDATVNHIVFYDNKHLFTAAEDGKIYVLKTKDWSVEKTLVKHTAGVTSLSVHPSGKLALSVGKDKKLVTWNLIKGRSAYVSNLYQVAEFVRWSTTGLYYAVGFYKKVDVYSVATAKVIFSVSLNGRANDVVFLDDDKLVLAGEMPEMEIYSIQEKKQIAKFEAHEKRIRCLHLIEEAENKVVCSASNDGWVKLWKIKVDGEKIEQALIGEYDTKCRITCMTVHRVPVATDQLARKDQKVMNTEDLADELRKKSGKKRKRVTMADPEKPEKAKCEDEKPKARLVEEQEISDAVETSKKGKRKKKKSL